MTLIGNMMIILSSLGLINEKLEKINYTLIATNITGSNAFYVINELVINAKKDKH